MTPSLSNVGRQNQISVDLCASCMAAAIANHDGSSESKTAYFERQNSKQILSTGEEENISTQVQNCDSYDSVIKSVQ